MKNSKLFYDQLIWNARWVKFWRGTRTEQQVKIRYILSNVLIIIFCMKSRAPITKLGISRYRIHTIKRQLHSKRNRSSKISM